jgi:hypothetical protein
MTFRCGDVVKHGPTGEEWLVAYCDGDDLAWCGWPDGLARTADCTLVRASTDDEHFKWLRDVAKSTGRRARMAQAALSRLEAA